MGLGGGALFQLGPYPTLKSETGGAPLPEETVMSPAAFRSFLGDLGESGRALYSSFQIWDLVNPLLIGFLGVTRMRGSESASEPAQRLRPPELVPR